MINKSSVTVYVLLAVSVGAMIIPTVIVLSVALIPTFVACIMERRNGIYGGVTVGALNMAGTAPYLVDLWFTGHTVAGATEIISSVFVGDVLWRRGRWLGHLRRDAKHR